MSEARSEAVSEARSEAMNEIKIQLQELLLSLSIEIQSEEDDSLMATKLADHYASILLVYNDITSMTCLTNNLELPLK